MDVTATNFDAATDELEALLPSADFIAFDEEMTGIMLNKDTAPGWADTCEARYAKMRRVVQEFTLMQVGICLFHAQPDGSLLSRPFNFYVFPPKESRRRISMDASTAHFHRANAMDFNKWVLHGVPYLSQAEHDVAAGAVAGVEEPPPPRPKVTLERDDDKAFVASAMEQLGDWLGGGGGGDGGDGGEAKEEPHAAPRELELPECNAFLRRAIFEQIEQRRAAQPELHAESRAVEGEERRKRVVVMRLSAAEQAARVEAARAARLSQLAQRAGFLRVWRLLCAAQKPLVGHNCTYDLLFLWAHFEAPLPETLGEWKRALHARLPRVWDTKLLALRSGRFPETVLERLHLACTTPPPPAVAVRFAPPFDRYEAGGQCHEAGYDAHLTGVVFATLRAAGLCDAQPPTLNRLYQMRSLWELDLGAAADARADPAAAAFHLSFDAAATSAGLLALVDAALRASLRWVDATSALLLVPLEHAPAAAAALDAARPAVASCTLDEWRARQAAAAPPAAAPPAAAPPAAAPAAPAAPAPAEPATEGAASDEHAAPATKRRRRGGAEAGVSKAPTAPRRSGRHAGKT